MSSGRALLASIVLTCACTVVACGSSAPQPAQTSASSTPAAPASSTAAAAPAPAQSMPMTDPTGNLIDHPARISDADIPPLPSVPFAPARPMDVVRAVFVFAAKHPEVLSHIPCFCGCEHMGHRNNDDCFVKARDAQERPVAWEPHGMGWGICLDVARDAMQMFATGAPVKAIRSAIEAKYGPAYQTMTPTPPIK